MRRNIGPNSKFIIGGKQTTKKIDAKCGKGFCKAVAIQTFTPVLGGRVIGEFVKSTFKQMSYKGVNGPMRTDRKYTYQQKSDLYIQSFVTICSTMVDEELLNRFQEQVLYRMVDDGMFMNLNFEQMMNQLRIQFASIPGVDNDILGVYLEEPEIINPLKKLWTE